MTIRDALIWSYISNFFIKRIENCSIYVFFHTKETFLIPNHFYLKNSSLLSKHFRL